MSDGRASSFSAGQLRTSSRIRSGDIAVLPILSATNLPGSGEARSHSTSAGLTTQKSRSISPARAHVRSANSMRSKRDGMTWDPWPWLKNSRQRRFGNAAA